MESKPQIDKSTIDQLLGSCKTETDLFGPDGIIRQLSAALMERMLSAEMTHHLGHEKNGRSTTGNIRNGHGKKSVITGDGTIEIDVPRDRDGEFEPQLVRKHQRRLAGFDEKVISLYARGMSTRDIQGHLEELYGTSVSPDLISTVTDAVQDEVKAWQSRTLDALYYMVYLDAIHVKVRDGHTVRSKAVYVALGINHEGRKEVLGLWISENEGAKFWLHVVTELQTRGLKDILIACVDGLKGFPEAIGAVFPKTTVQVCIVHTIRYSIAQVAWKDQKAVAKSLRPVWEAPTEEAALLALDAFSQEWSLRYPSIARSWRANWDKISPFYGFTAEIRCAIYTTNAIESLNFQLRKSIKTRGHFPTDEAVFKVFYLALDRASKKWTMPIRDWKQARQQFAIYFEGRVTL